MKYLHEVMVIWNFRMERAFNNACASNFYMQERGTCSVLHNTSIEHKRVISCKVFNNFQKSISVNRSLLGATQDVSIYCGLVNQKF